MKEMIEINFILKGKVIATKRIEASEKQLCVNQIEQIVKANEFLQIDTESTITSNKTILIPATLLKMCIIEFKNYTEKR